MKAKTIEQYYILDWIKKHFLLNFLDIIFIDRDQVLIIDSDGDSAIIKCEEDRTIIFDFEERDYLW